MDEVIQYRHRASFTIAAAAALSMGMAFAPMDFPPPHSPGRRKVRKSAKAIKAAKLHALQRKARRITRAHTK